MEQLVSLDGNTISPSEVMAIVSGKARVELAEDAWSRIIQSRKVIDNILSSRGSCTELIQVLALW